MDWQFPYPSTRMPLLAANCVATTQPLAAQAGLAMLANGGNAVDAAVATAIALTVVEPVMNGIGSDAFAIVAADGGLHGLNASGRAPQPSAQNGVWRRFRPQACRGCRAPRDCGHGAPARAGSPARRAARPRSPCWRRRRSGPPSASRQSRKVTAAPATTPGTL